MPSTLNAQSSTFTKLLWLLLPACASTLLLAVTNKICQDVAVIPFLWVLPLALYLLSFIICFDNPRWYARFPFALAFIAAVGAMSWVLFKGVDASIRTQVWIYSAGLCVCCMVCHGELYRLRPDPKQLTSFYLMIAAGGALGGLFVAVAAPMVFTDYFEIHWALLLCGLLFTVVSIRDKSPASLDQWRWLACALTLAVFGGLDWALAWLGKHQHVISKSFFLGTRLGMWTALALLVALWIARKRFQTFRYWRFLALVWLTLGWAGPVAALWIQWSHAPEPVIARSRNFYGTLKVCEYWKNDPESHYFLLRHGRITHGLQLLDARYANVPTTYYSRGSGIALAVDALPSAPRRIGVIGLGTGTMAAFGRAGDTMRIYEINPAVQQLATSQFSYLSNSPAKVEVTLGDARLSMEREPPQNYDLFALDAFSSDAIPVHLLTKEAFELYGRHLKTNGIIAVHISNHYLNLEPVVENAARQLNYHWATVDCEEDRDDEEEEWWVYASTWVLLTRNDEVVRRPGITWKSSATKTNAPTIPLWTDDFASVFQILE